MFYINMMSVSFLGLKENIQYGKQAVKMVQEEYPNGFISNTHKETFKKGDNSLYLEDAKKVAEMRELVHNRIRHGISKRQATESAVKETQAANCGEQAMLVSNRLNQLGIKNKLVSMTIYPKTNYYAHDSHTFCVIDTDYQINPSNPKEWSKDAVVVDMWSDTIAKAQDALDYFLSFLKYSPETDRIIYSSVFE